MGRVFFSDTCTIPGGPGGTLIPLSDIAYVPFIVNIDGTEGAQANAFVDRVGNVATPTLATGADGSINYWLEAGDYNIHVSDQHSPPRIASSIRGFTAPSGFVDFLEGTLSNRPAAGIIPPGTIYYATDTNQWFLNTGSSWTLDFSPPTKGAVNIATTGTRTNTAYGFLDDANDQVSGIVLPTNGIIRVLYQATWRETIANAARAAIFVGANQLEVADRNGVTLATESSIGATANLDVPLSSYNGGLVSMGSGTGYTGDVVTGQIIGNAQIAGGGAVEIFAAPGIYTVSVQFKASSGNVVAKNRKLWVEAKSYTS